MKTCLRFLLLISLPVFLHAQAANRASQKATVSSLLPTNGTGSITAANLRTVVNSVIDSAYNPLDDGAPLSSASIGVTVQGYSAALGTFSTNGSAFYLSRANHTGTQSADTLTDGTANKAYTAAEQTKLAGIAAGATANSTDVFLLSRANHTGTQAANTITGLSASATTDTTNAANITSGTLPNARIVALPNANLANSAITIAGTSVSLGGSISLDTITGIVSTGITKRTGANAYGIAVAGTDYLAPNGSGAGLSGVALSSVHPNTAPAAGQVMVGNAGGTAYAPVTVSGDVTISSSGVTAIGAAKVTNSMLAGSIDASTKLTNATPIANGGTGATTVGAANQALTPASVVLTPSAGAVTINWASSNAFDITLNANLSTVTFSNAADGQTIVVAITNTASNYTVTWGNSIKWPGGTQPTQTTGAKTDVWTITKHGSTYYGNVVQNF